MSSFNLRSRKRTEIGLTTQHASCCATTPPFKARVTLHVGPRRVSSRPLQVLKYFRSCWEANFARILNLQGKHRSYESRTFQLEPSLSYTPDFYVEDDDIFYELKDHLDEKSKRQLDLIRATFPEVTVYLIDGVKYAELRLEYRDKVR